MSQPAKESARRRKTRERLMDAARNLFAEHGVNAVSIETVAEAAGFTRGAFYSNFETKNELFFAMMRRECELQLERLRETLGQKVAPNQKISVDTNFITDVIHEVFAALPHDRTWALNYGEFELLALRDKEAAGEFLSLAERFRTELAVVIEASSAALNMRFRIDTLLVADLVMEQGKQAMREMLMRGAQDPSITRHEIVLETMPAVLFQLVESDAK